MVYEIREDYLGYVMERYEKLKAKYIKNNTEHSQCAVKLSIDDRYTKVVNGVEIPFVKISVESFLIVNDFVVIAHLQATDEGNIITPYVKLPDSAFTVWYNIPLRCDHCNVNRYRKHSFVVRNTKTGKLQQVGDSCLDKYLGGTSLVRAREIERFLGLFTPESLNGMYERGPAPMYYYPDLIASLVSKRNYKAGLYEDIDDKQLKFIEEFHNWVNSQDSSIVKWHNYQTLIKTRFIHADLVEKVKSMLVSYRCYLKAKKRELEEEEKRRLREIREKEEAIERHKINVEVYRNSLEKLLDKNELYISTYRQDKELINKNTDGVSNSSNHLGNINDKVEVTICNVELKVKYDSMYGGHYGGYWMTTSDGDILEWGTQLEKVVDKYDFPSEKGLEKEVAFILSGFVKEHKSYGRNKVTVVKNCRLKSSAVQKSSVLDNKKSTIAKIGYRTLENYKLGMALVDEIADYDKYIKKLDVQKELDSQSVGVSDLGKHVDIDLVSIRIFNDGYGKTLLVRGTDNNLFKIYYDEKVLKLLGVVLSEHLNIEVPLCKGCKIRGTLKSVHFLDGIKYTWVTYAQVL